MQRSFFYLIFVLILTGCYFKPDDVETKNLDRSERAPELRLQDPPQNLAGGSEFVLDYDAIDSNGIESTLLEYSPDGVNWVTVAVDPDPGFTWTVPEAETTEGHLRLVVTDNMGNTSAIMNETPFVVDSTPPTVSLDPIAGPLKGGSTTAVSWTSADDNGIENAKLEFSADGLTYVPLSDSAESAFAWNSPTIDTTGGKIRLTVTDAAGNEKAVESNVFEIDSSGPTLSIDDLDAVIKGGVVESVSFTHGDPNGVATWSLEYAADGNTFSPLATDPVSPHSWTAPTSDTSASKLRITAIDGLGNVSTAETGSFSIDSTAPDLTLNDLAAVVQGGSAQAVSFTMSDLHGIGSWTLSYAEDGAVFSEASQDPASPYSWSAPVVDSTGSKLQLTATDSVGNSATVANAAFNIDSTAATPALSPQNFDSSIGTNLNPLTLTASGCADIAQIMLQESSSAPLPTDPGWQACSTASGALNFDPSVTNQQGFRTMRAYGMDPSGNVSSPQLINFIYDTEAPIMAFETIPTLPWGATYPIEWTLTEASVDPSETFILEYSLDNGATWSLVGNVPVGTSGPHSEKAYSYGWSPPTTLTTEALFKVSLTDNSNQTGSAQSNMFTILEDLNSPNLYTSEMTVNGSASPPPTSSKYVKVSLEAIDNETNISHFCLKSSSSVPSLSDPCWRAVDAPIPGLSPSTTLNLVDFPHLLGYVPATYNIYGWARDLKGNISANTGTVGKDLVSITYQPDSPPVISNFFASNTSSPPDPITNAEMVFNVGDPVHIKWTASDDKGITPTIRLYYTTDDENYTLIADGLNNGVNNCGSLDDGGTTLDDSSTGCYQWTSPFSTTDFFRLQLVVADTATQDTSILSSNLNSSVFQILAGNVDPGVGSSAKSSMLTPKGTFYTLAVASDGKVFFNDAANGLLYINPQTGILEQLLKVTGTYSGDLGPVREATAMDIRKITMDYEDRLLIWDGQRIRRVDTKTEPMQIETIIGGYNNGALGAETTDIITDPADLLIEEEPAAATLFHPLPNGDIYFQSAAYNDSVNAGNVLRVYRGSLSSPDIQTIRVWGSGAYATNNGVEMNLSNDQIRGYFLNYDVNTSAITKIMANMYRKLSGCSYYVMSSVDTTTYESLGLSTESPNPHPPVFASTCGDNYSRLGLDGNMYRLGEHIAYSVKVSKYNAASNSYTTVFGTGGNGAEGYCPDGTAATSCKIKVSDFFVNPSGQFFMVDSGTIRVIDGAGNVQTLYGQTKVYGDGGLAQDARFNNTPYIDHGVDDNVIVYDSPEKVLREIRPNQSSAQVVSLAGNGETGTINFAAPAAGQTLNGKSWDQPGSFVTDPSTGNVFFPCVGAYICRLNRSTGLWEEWAGGGSTHWLTTGSASGLNIQLGGYNKGILSAHNGKFLTGHYSWSGTHKNNGGLREFDMFTASSTYIAGKMEDDGATGCPDGAGTGCNLNANRSTGRAFTYHTGEGKWLYEHNDDVIKFVNVNGTSGNVETFDVMSEPIHSMLWNSNSLYFCTEEGVLKRRDYSTMTEETIPFPTDSIECYGNDMLFKPASGLKPDRLVFPFRQKGLAGVAEYFLY